MTESDYDLRKVLSAFWRFWWIAISVPVLILIVLTVRNLTAEFETSFKASILMPGDAEIPGSAERPELMILDDLGPVVRSQAFAQMVATAAGLELSVVEGTLDSTRYSRIATVTISSDSKDRSAQIASAAASVFSTAINTLMVAQGGDEATVIVIDPPGTTIRGHGDKWTITAIATAVGLMIGCFLALATDATFAGLRRLAD